MGEAAYDPMSYAWRVLLVLALVFAGAVWVRTRWRGPGRGAQPRTRLHVVDSLALGPQRHVHVLEADGRRYLIGVTPQQITLLTALDRRLESGPDFPTKGDEGDALDFRTFLEKAAADPPGEDSAT